MTWTLYFLNREVSWGNPCCSSVVNSELIDLLLVILNLYLVSIIMNSQVFKLQIVYLNLIFKLSYFNLIFHAFIVWFFEFFEELIRIIVALFEIFLDYLITLLEVTEISWRSLPMRRNISTCSWSRSGCCWMRIFLTCWCSFSKLRSIPIARFSRCRLSILSIWRNWLLWSFFSVRWNYLLVIFHRSTYWALLVSL